MRSTQTVIVMCSKPGYVILPLTSAPGAKGDSSVTPNHWLNCATSVMARQTRERGAFSTTDFSMRSVEEGMGSDSGWRWVVGVAEQLGESGEAEVPQALVGAAP